MGKAKLLNRSAEEILRAVERHRALLEALDRSAAGQDGGPCKGHDGHRCNRLDVCVLVDCSHRRQLRRTLVEAVTVLEQTRRAFKSKQLEALRKRMIEILAEDACD